MDSDKKTGANVAGAHCNREGGVVPILNSPTETIKIGRAVNKKRVNDFGQVEFSGHFLNTLGHV